MKIRLTPTIATMLLCTTVLVAMPKPANAFIGEAAVVAAISGLQKFTGNALSSMTKTLTSQITSSMESLSNPNSVSSMLNKGFTQLSNYEKAGVAAEQRIADASNTAMAEFARRQQDTTIRDEHIMNPEFCTGIDGAQATHGASQSARTATRAIATITDSRGEADAGTPSYYGKGQGVASSMALHGRRYCSQEDVTAGLCSALSRLPNADQRAISLFGQDTLSADGGVDAANDYSTTLIQPVAPAALRGEQLTSTSGREAALRRRAYNARMSLSRYVMNFITSLEIPSINLTDVQKTEMQAEGMTVSDQASWLTSMSLEVNRRVSGVTWNKNLQQMPPATVMRELAIEQAQANYLALQTYRLGLFQSSLAATQVAQHEEESEAKRLAPIPSPNVNPGG